MTSRTLEKLGITYAWVGGLELAILLTLGLYGVLLPGLGVFGAVLGLATLTLGAGILERARWSRILIFPVTALGVLIYPLGTVFYGVSALVLFTETKRLANARERLVHGVPGPSGGGGVAPVRTPVPLSPRGWPGRAAVSRHVASKAHRGTSITR